MERIMISNPEKTQTVIEPKVKDVKGLLYRGFRGEEDFPGMLKVLHGCAKVDGVERSEQLEDIINDYAHLHHCNPIHDMLFAEVDGIVVGYTRCWWEVEGSGTWVGFQMGNVLPEWRRNGIGSTLLGFCEKRLARVATELKESGRLPVDAACLLDNFVRSSEVDRIFLLERRGYSPARYAFDMVRPDLDNIPELSLPGGVEVRPVEPEHLRLIFDASNEAFRDHWGYIPDPWVAFEGFIQSPDYDPSLWRVAWHDDQVVGMVLSFIDKDENEIYGRKRGYTENICVRRPWRKQGVAKALIASSLKALKEAGMNEAGLGVDAENISGALNLYKSMGFQVVKRLTIYRKPINV